MRVLSISINFRKFIMIQSGYIYVLANPSTSGIVKIGKTRQNPVERAKELSSASGVPTPFIVVYHAYFDDCIQAEQFVHAKLQNSRVSNNREFFQIPIPVAVDAVVEAQKRLLERLDTNQILLKIKALFKMSASTLLHLEKFRNRNEAFMNC